MAKMSATALNNALRELWMANIINMVIDENEVLRVSASKIAIPVLDEENNEKWITISVSVPKGTNDGEPYNGYEEAEAYEEAVATKRAKAELREQEKERKAAEREAKRKEKEGE